MQIIEPKALRLQALAAALLLTACGGGADSVPTAAPASTFASQTAALHSSAEEQAQAAIGAAGAVQRGTLLAQLIDTIPFAGDDTRPPRGCHSGVKVTVTVGPELSIINIDSYYDKACKTPLAYEVVNGLHFPVGGGTSFSGTATLFALSGAAVGYASFSNKSQESASGQNAPEIEGVTRGTVALTKGGRPFLKFGLTCRMTRSSATSENFGNGKCGLGEIVTLSASGAAYGYAAWIHGFAGSGKSSGTYTVSTYEGNAATLKLVKGRDMAWLIRGGRSFASQDGAFAETVTPLLPIVAAALTSTSSATMPKASLNFGNLTGIANGSIVNPGAPTANAATFSTDPLGNGTIRYSDGTKAAIEYFVIGK
jgi:hypothetical protein